MVVRPADPLDVVEVATQRLGVGLLQGLPDVAQRLAGHPRDVGEALPDRERVGHLGHVVAEQVVERRAAPRRAAASPSPR